MAIRNTSWDKVKAGQIVNFIYKNKKESKGVKRTVLIVNSDFKYRKKSTGRIKRFVVGLQLQRVGQRPLPKGQLEEIFNSLGGIEIEDGTLAGKITDKADRNQGETTKIYNKLRGLVNRLGMWRTFDRRECMKRRVYLEIDSPKIPEETIKGFESIQRKNIEDLLERDNVN